MRFALGGTRFVILTRRWAIKVAHPRLYRLYCGFMRRYTRKEIRLRLEEESPHVCVAIMKCMMLGVICNLNEWRFSRQYKNADVEPVIFSLWGLINIQARGEPVREDELASCPFQNEIERDHSRHTSCDIDVAHQFARFNGHVRLIDYGNTSSVVFLQEQPTTMRSAHI